MFLLSQKFSYLRHIFRTKDWAKIFVFLAFIFVALGVALAAYAGFLRGFQFFARDAYFGDALTLYMLEATMLVVMVLVFVSAAVSGIFTLFSSRENQFLLALPISRFRLFKARFIENALSSAWPIVLIGVPAVMALARARGLAVWQTTGFALVILLVFLAVVGLAAALDFGIVRIFRIVRGPVLALVVGVLIVGAAYVLGKALLPADLNRLFRAEEFTTASSGIDLLFGHFRVFPTHGAVLYLVGNENQSYMLPTLYGFFAAVITFFGLWALARHFYLALLQRSFEGTFIAREEDKARIRRGLRRFPVLAKTSFGALAEKDVLTFFRSSRELSRAFFLIFMLFLYLFLFRRLPTKDVVFSADILTKILLFYLAAIGYFVTTLSLRFVFPLVSLEGKSAWALFASPVPRTRIFWEKLLVSLLPILVAVVPLTLAALGILGLTGISAAAFLRFAVWMTVTLVTLALSIGTLWPNFGERDPDKLSTTLPGLFATTLSLGYVALMSAAGFFSMRAYFSVGSLVPPVIFLAIVPTFFFIGLFLWLGLKRVRILEV